MNRATTTTTTRITRRFDELRRTGELGLVAYLAAGDPTLEATERIVPALVEAGADVIELGVPFSDPLADGPTIQHSSERLNTFVDDNYVRDDQGTPTTQNWLGITSVGVGQVFAGRNTNVGTVNRGVAGGISSVTLSSG